MRFISAHEVVTCLRSLYLLVSFVDKRGARSSALPFLGGHVSCWLFDPHPRAENLSKRRAVYASNTLHMDTRSFRLVPFHSHSSQKNYAYRI